MIVSLGLGLNARIGSGLPVRVDHYVWENPQLLEREEFADFVEKMYDLIEPYAVVARVWIEVESTDGRETFEVENPDDGPVMAAGNLWRRIEALR